MAFRLFNYDKPGPGVSKDEPPKPPFIRFWQIFFRKWTNFIKINFLFLIPFIVVLALIYFLNVYVSTQPLIFLTPVILLYPVAVGITYVTRNYAREEHAFILSDFWDALKGNLKFSLINGVICYLMFCFMMIAFPFYYQMSSENGFYYVPLAICAMITLLFIFAQYYIPIMIVTFDLKFRELYKNAFIFAILGLWRNFLLTILYALIAAATIVLLLWNYLALLFVFLCAILITFSFCSYLGSFIVYPLIDKMMIKPYYARQAAIERGEDPDKITAASLAEEEDESRGEEMDDEDEPEFVFINGKLVRKKEPPKEIKEESTTGTEEPKNDTQA